MLIFNIEDVQIYLLERAYKVDDRVLPLLQCFDLVMYLMTRSVSVSLEIEAVETCEAGLHLMEARICL